MCALPPEKTTQSPGPTRATCRMRRAAASCAAVSGGRKSEYACSSKSSRDASPYSQIASSLWPAKFLPTLLHIIWSTCKGEPPNRPPTKRPSSYRSQYGIAIARDLPTQSHTPRASSVFVYRPSHACRYLAPRRNSAR